MSLAGRFIFVMLMRNVGISFNNVSTRRPRHSFIYCFTVIVWRSIHLFSGRERLRNDSGWV